MTTIPLTNITSLLPEQLAPNRFYGPSRYVGCPSVSHFSQWFPVHATRYGLTESHRSLPHPMTIRNIKAALQSQNSLRLTFTYPGNLPPASLNLPSHPPSTPLPPPPIGAGARSFPLPALPDHPNPTGCPKNLPNLCRALARVGNQSRAVLLIHGRGRRAHCPNHLVRPLPDPFHHNQASYLYLSLSQIVLYSSSVPCSASMIASRSEIRLAVSPSDFLARSIAARPSSVIA